jgi:RimJ/RimL family protein N-acetyltransferase
VQPTFQPATFSDIETQLRQHIGSLPSAIDSFLERHILDSAHYEITVPIRTVGYASIHQGSLITQFVLLSEFRRYGQVMFSQLRQLETVQSAFVPTCDEFFLAHALDGYREVAKQAYFFAAPADDIPHIDLPLELHRATENDMDFILKNSETFFGTSKEIQHKIDNHELFLIYSDRICMSFGVMEKSRLMASVASIGMFVIPKFRQKGIGSDTLRLLMLECHRQGVQPIAGCWYYNHLSKKTLERAGMFTQTRLLKFHF